MFAMGNFHGRNDTSIMTSLCQFSFDGLILHPAVGVSLPRQIRLTVLSNEKKHGFYYIVKFRADSLKSGLTDFLYFQPGWLTSEKVNFQPCMQIGE